MIPKLQISALLLQRLERVKQQCSGCLFGVFYGEGTLLLMNYTVESTIGQLNHEQIQHQFPAELDLCGLVKFGDCSDAEAHLTDIFKDVDITDNPILLNCELGTLVGLRASIYMHGKLQEVPYEVLDESRLYNDFCFTRLRCCLSIFTEQNPKSVHHEMQLLRKSLSGGSLAFNVVPTKIYVTSQGVQGLNVPAAATAAASPTTVTTPSTGIRLNADTTMAHMAQAVAQALTKSQGTVVDANKENNANKDMSRKQKQNAHINNGSGDEFIPLRETYGALGCDYEILNIGVLRCKTRQIDVTQAKQDQNSNLPTVVMRVQREERKVCLPLDLDAMAILCKRTQVNRLYNVLIESICRALRLFERTIIEHLAEVERTENSDKSLEFMSPRNYHFYPQDFGHFITCAYVDGVSDDEHTMQEKRKRLHRNFGQINTRPYFRRANRCLFRDELTASTPPLNVHVGVRASGISEGKAYLVQGNYYYYHYMQQQINDKGWGCAYRSLQTLCSWFLLQGYTERSVPTHYEIQQYLVRIGDKPQSFVGSSQWIGSTEVSMCLQGFLEVDSRILHVKSGAEMAQLAPDLAMHFQLQGTPIMIGGGVLAHTILGIDYNSQNGQVKFLILDPHFVGTDDLQTIHAKGWCGWKGVDFWDKRSYYNLCLPQRPVIF